MNANYKEVDYSVDKPSGSMNNIRPICKYAGSKTRLLFYILYAAFLTCTSTFYDLCGGSGVVTMNLLDCVNRKIINDISVVHAVIFKVLANEHMALKLDDLLYNGSPIPTWKQYCDARKYWYTHKDAKLSDIPAEELVHAAYCGLLLLWGERLGSKLNIGTPIEKISNKQTDIMKHIKSQWISYREKFLSLHVGMNGADVQNRDLLDILREMVQNYSDNPDSIEPNTTIYIDPPYLSGKSNGHKSSDKTYNERIFGEDAHKEMLELLDKLPRDKCKIIISGYDSELYDTVLNTEGFGVWTKVFVTELTVNCTDGRKSKERSKAKEFFFVNFQWKE